MKRKSGRMFIGRSLEGLGNERAMYVQSSSVSCAAWRVTIDVHR